MVVREHEDLGLAREAPKRGGVQDAVAVSLEAGAPGVWLLGDLPCTGADGDGGSRDEPSALSVLACLRKMGAPLRVGT